MTLAKLSLRHRFFRPRALLAAALVAVGACAAPTDGGTAGGNAMPEGAPDDPAVDAALDKALADAASMDDEDDGDRSTPLQDLSPEGAAVRASGVSLEALEDIDPVAEVRTHTRFASPTHFTDFYSGYYRVYGPNPGGIPGFQGYVLRHQNSGMLYLYTYNHFVSGQVYPSVLDPRTVDYSQFRSIHGTFGDHLCCFYGNLPETIQAFAYPSKVGFDLPRDQLWKAMNLPVLTTFKRPVIASARLDAVRAEAIRSALGSDPFVKYGLAGLTTKLIAHVPDGYGHGKSPTHFDRRSRVLYVNENDLKEYGFVVVVHEALHAAVHKARVEGIITREQYDRIALINENHFGKFSGYAGVNGAPYDRDNDWLGPITQLNLLRRRTMGMEKAFTIGYTYRLLKQLYPKLTASQKAFATKFMRDVEGNAEVSTLFVSLWLRVGSFRVPLRMLGQEATQADVNRFTSSFMNVNSPVFADIRPVLQAVRARVNTP